MIGRSWASGIFQSTPPARGATKNEAACGTCREFQSTPPARGATLPRGAGGQGQQHISIHAPREGGDGPLPARDLAVIISIHAPREGGDVHKSYSGNPIPDFNPRPPRGGRRCTSENFRIASLFQSTPPARGATTAEVPAAETLENFNPRPPRGGRRWRWNGLTLR